MYDIFKIKGIYQKRRRKWKSSIGIDDGQCSLCTNLRKILVRRREEIKLDRIMYERKKNISCNTRGYETLLCQFITYFHVLFHFVFCVCALCTVSCEPIWLHVFVCAIVACLEFGFLIYMRIQADKIQHNETTKQNLKKKTPKDRRTNRKITRNTFFLHFLPNNWTSNCEMNVNERETVIPQYSIYILYV